MRRLKAHAPAVGEGFGEWVVGEEVVERRLALPHRDQADAAETRSRQVVAAQRSDRCHYAVAQARRTQPFGGPAEQRERWAPADLGEMKRGDQAEVRVRRGLMLLSSIPNGNY